jgi:hypothetical protein
VRCSPAWELVSWSNESASKDVNTEAEEPTELGAVIRRQPVKIQQNEKIEYVL